MKITSIQAVKLQMPQVATPSTTQSASSVTSPHYAMGHPQAESKTRAPSAGRRGRGGQSHVALSAEPHRSMWLPKEWGAVWCKITTKMGPGDWVLRRMAGPSQL